VSCSTYFAGETVIHRLDPRPRVVVTFGFALVVSLVDGYLALSAALAVGALASLMARLSHRPLARRLLHVNVFMGFLFLTLPLTTPGQSLFRVASLSYTREGVAFAAMLTMKANAIVLVFTSLLGTIELSALGHALQHLRVPDRLVHLFLFTLRYLDVVHHAHVDLLRAMKARGFRPRMNLHTYRSYGSLVAMLLIRSLERAERVMAAMKCRGFKGRFVTYRRFVFRRRDAVFCVVGLAAMCLCVCLELVSGGSLR
jgi:cobalt/nickel transport system permease protein